MRHASILKHGVAATALALALSSPLHAQDGSVDASGEAAAAADVTFDLQAVVDFAGDRAAAVVAQLMNAGYEVIDMSRTLLGRSKITLQNEVHIRQIVFSRATGEIQQDVIVATRGEAGGDQPGAGAAANIGVDIGANADVDDDSASGSVGVSVGIGN